MTFPLFLSALSDDSSRDRRLGRGSSVRDLTTGAVSRTQCPVDAINGRPVSELLTQIRNDDRDAFAALYAGLFHFLWTVAVAYTRSADTAEELVHDVFLRLWIRRDAIKIDTDIRVYLAVAVRNHARNLTKHERVVDAVDQSSSYTDADIPAIGQPAPSPNAAVEDDEFQEAYRRMLGMLTERERTAVFLRWEEGLTLDQIGAVLSVSTEGVRKIILRVQQKAQIVLAEYRG